MRLVDVDEALELFPPLYEQARAQRPGMFPRSKDVVGDCGGCTTIRRAARERPEAPRRCSSSTASAAGYAIYRQAGLASAARRAAIVDLEEVVSPTPEATRELWRWLLDFDWTSEFAADFLPLDHPLFLLLAEPRRMQFVVNDGLWVRLVDVGAALAARGYLGEGELVLEVTDELLPENAGRWRVTPATAERTDDAADLRLDVTGVGSVYLGGFGFADLVRASRAEELTPGAAERGDALFRTGLAPWCPEIF